MYRASCTYKVKSLTSVGRLPTDRFKLTFMDGLVRQKLCNFCFISVHKNIPKATGARCSCSPSGSVLILVDLPRAAAASSATTVGRQRLLVDLPRALSLCFSVSTVNLLRVPSCSDIGGALLPVCTWSLRRSVLGPTWPSRPALAPQGLPPAR
jgi:hypothetical protein